ncbi:MAG TPA: hypothetical protein VLZ05_00040 [Mycobacterium sp.]|nr:hypothetical protein [Mycobacterium sp.]HUH67413.1 hypothetical protein [Mycobacterium sp.]
MPRLNRAGKDIGRVLEWLLNRDVRDGEIGYALNLAKATYSRRKDADDFPHYAELTALGEYFGLSPRVLQIAFGWRGEDELILLNVEEMRQYMEQAGAAVFGIEAVRCYIEERGQGDGRLATAIRTLVEAVDPNPDRIQHAETDT